MKIAGLTLDTIESNADSGSVQRGREYLENDAVKSLRRRSENEIEAYVQGSDIAPYHVQIKHGPQGVVSAECSCPYVGGTWCRHIVATLLAILDGGGRDARSLSGMLDEFDRVELIHLIEELANAYPDVAAFIESEFSRRR